ncbi:MAG: hypothetical protein K8L97_32050 [Anaerolineae bacterium]|nr:hypothetical protein [Anaerolineae bacterium]
MSEAQAQRAIQNMYADPSVREELIDEEADVLLKWGETQFTSLAAQNWDDAHFEAASSNLNRLLNEINRFIGKRAYWPPAEQTASLAEIARLAETLQYKAAPAALEAFAQQYAAIPNPETIAALTTLLKPSAAPDNPDAPIPEDKPPAKTTFGALLQSAAAAINAASLNTETTSSAEGESLDGEENT